MPETGGAQDPWRLDQILVERLLLGLRFGGDKLFAQLELEDPASF